MVIYSAAAPPNNATVIKQFSEILYFPFTALRLSTAVSNAANMFINIKYITNAVFRLII